MKKINIRVVGDQTVEMHTWPHICQEKVHGELHLLCEIEILAP